MPKIVGYVGSIPPTEEHQFPWKVFAAVGAGAVALVWFASKISGSLVANIDGLTDEQIAEGKRRLRFKRIGEFSPDVLAKINTAIDQARKGEPSVLPPKELKQTMESLGVMADLARLPPGRYTFDLDPKFSERKRKWSRNRWRRYKDSTSLRGAFASTSRAADGSDSPHVFVDTKGAPTGVPESPYTPADPVVLGLYREDGEPAFLIYAPTATVEPLIADKQRRADDRVQRMFIREGRLERRIFGMMSSRTREALAEEKRRKRKELRQQEEEEKDLRKAVKAKQSIEKVFEEGKQMTAAEAAQLKGVISESRQERKEAARQTEELKEATAKAGKVLKSGGPAEKKSPAAPQEKKPRTSRAQVKETKPKAPKASVAPSAEVAAESVVEGGEPTPSVSPEFVLWFESVTRKLKSAGVTFPQNTFEGLVIGSPAKLAGQDQLTSMVQLAPGVDVAIDSEALSQIDARQGDKIRVRIRYDGSIPVEVAYEKLQTGVSSREAKKFLTKLRGLKTSKEMKEAFTKLMMTPGMAEIAKSLRAEADVIVKSKRAEEESATKARSTGPSSETAPSLSSEAGALSEAEQALLDEKKSKSSADEAVKKAAFDWLEARFSALRAADPAASSTRFDAVVRELNKPAQSHTLAVGQEEVVFPKRLMPLVKQGDKLVFEVTRDASGDIATLAVSVDRPKPASSKKPAAAPVAQETPPTLTPEIAARMRDYFASKYFGKDWFDVRIEKVNAYLARTGKKIEDVPGVAVTADEFSITGVVVQVPGPNEISSWVRGQFGYGIEPLPVKMFEPDVARVGDAVTIVAKMKNGKFTSSRYSIVPAQEQSMEKNSRASQQDPALYREFRRTINMSSAEIERWRRNPQHRDASLPHIRAELPLLAQMKRTPMSKWTPKMWNKAMRAVNFVKRHEAQMKVQAKRYGTGRLHATYKRIIGLLNWGRKTPGVNIRSVLAKKSSKGRRTSRNPAPVRARKTSRGRRISRSRHNQMSVMNWLR
jgi:hypothetical protein